jgi:hypothetical protein
MVLYAVSLGWPEIISRRDRPNEDIPCCNFGVQRQEASLKSVSSSIVQMQPASFPFSCFAFTLQTATKVLRNRNTIASRISPLEHRLIVMTLSRDFRRPLRYN